ncbi:MAG: ribonuclease J [Hyphomicrobiaceae bacterium]
MARRPASKGADELAFVALGGIGEIGMNLYLYGFGPPQDRRWLMVDLGITFPGVDEPGVDVIMPDTRFIEENRADLVGIVLTHAHEDHFGAVVDLWPRLKAPIFATPFTAALLRAKLEERPGLKLPITEVPLGSRFAAGPFDVELVTVAHSIPEPNALAIRTPLGLVVHTGDWKLDPDPLIGQPTDEARLAALGEEGVDALVCDSTNAMREGISPSEAEVARSLAGIIERAEQRVIVTTFASNVARIRSIAEAARSAGRDIVIAGRALHRVIAVGQETGYLPANLKFHDQDAYGYLDRRHVLAICTGSQGEPRAAMARIAEDSHPSVSVAAGDTVIFSSRTIPGNEKAVGRVQNGLAGLGARVVTDAEGLVHVTGHPRRGELKRIYELTRPRALIPMHGEIRHLEEQGRFARAQGVGHVVAARNGTLVRILPGPAAIVDDVPVGRIHRDGNILIDAEDGPARQRRRLSFAGIVVVSLVVERDGRLAADPEVVTDGLPGVNADGVEIETLILDAVEDAIESIPRARRKDHSVVREAAQRAARSAVNEAWGKKPICKVMVTVV